MATNYRMGSTRPHRYASIKPDKPDLLKTDNVRERSVVGAKWKPVYDELCRRMFGREPGALDFAWEGDTLITRPFDYIGPRVEGWTRYATPAEAMEALGIAALVKAQAKATRPKANPTPNPPKVEPVQAEPSSSSWPAWADDYLNRLVYPPKRDYAVAWLEHTLNGAPAPADPGAEWADKVRRRVDKLATV
jgi:hypothetical protein